MSLRIIREKFEENYTHTGKLVTNCRLVCWPLLLRLVHGSVSCDKLVLEACTRGVGFTAVLALCRDLV